MADPFPSTAALARILGYDSTEELLNSVSNLRDQFYVQPEQRDELVRILQECGSLEQWETQVRRKDGRIIWVSLSIRAVCDDSGQILHFEGMLEDITRRKEVEHLQRLEEDRLRLALDVAGMLSWDWEIGTNKVAYSEDLGEYFGLPPTGAVLPNDQSKTLLPVHPDDRERLMEAFRQALKTGTDFEMEFRGPRRNNEQTWYFIRVRIQETRDGQPWRMIGITQDITFRKQAEESLRQSNDKLERRVQVRTQELQHSEQRFRSLVEHAPIGIWQVGSDGNTIQYLNPAMRGILGIPLDENVCGKLIMDYIAPEKCDVSISHLDLCLRGLSSCYEIEYLVHKPTHPGSGLRIASH